MDVLHRLPASRILLLSLLVVLAACQAPPVEEPATRVDIVSGALVGTEHSENVQAWLGIPYARPPVGELRWRAPQPARKWAGVLSATDFGAACVQYPNFTIDQQPRAPRITVGEEDCLTLNVFAPAGVLEAQTRLPVMVWIHGGGNTTGASLSYDGGPLAEGQQVVVVTFNYRLGLFGYFRHPALRDESASSAERSGNFGTLDILAALQWVQQNIGAFGGDAKNVTLFGESAGGRNTWAMVQTQLAKGLFHKAIVQSGSLRLMDPDKAEAISPDAADYPSYRNNTAEVLSRVLADAESMSNIQLVQTLRAKSADEIYAGIELDSLDNHRQPRLFLDGYMFSRPALETFQDPALYNAVPIITGSNRDEDKLFMQFDPKWVDKRFGLFRKLKDPERYNNVATYAANYWRVLTVDEPARVISAHGGAPVYAYRFDFDNHATWPVNFVEMAGAAHAFEIPFVFGTHEQAPWKHIFRAREERSELSQTMMDYWGAFAYTSTPGRGRSLAQPAWQRWRNDAERLMVFDVDSDGGVRMTDAPMRVAEIKHRLAVDESMSQQEKCAGYRSLFLNGYQTEDFYDEIEYRSFAGGRCPL